MGRCEICGKEIDIPFKCAYCGGYFCYEHHIPENHNCQKKPTVTAEGIRAPRFPKENPREIGTCPRCHRDGSKVIKFNSEKAIFKCWNCGLVYGQKKIFPYYYFRVRKHKRVRKPQPETSPITVTPYVPRNPQAVKAFEHSEKKRKITKNQVIVGVLIAIGLIAAIIVIVNVNNPFLSNIGLPSSTPSIFQTPNSNHFLPSPNPTYSLPTIAPTATPSAEDQQDLVNYALSLINTDRQLAGLQNVTLSSINSGQIHADDMLKNGYFSHWDTSGYKPYMRYTLAGGKGAVAENIGWVGDWETARISLKQALNGSEWGMMYDDAACNWGHKDNILNSMHNEVSIGIACDSNNVYFVEDFINNYVSWSQLSVGGNEVTMQGTTQTQTNNIQQIAIFYDNPVPLTVNQLGQSPYNGGYDPGTFVGLVLTGNRQAQNGITITADNWQQNGNNFQISFSLSQAIAVYGKGIYTLYLETGYSTADSLTTYSIWV